jgi:hypothetical protein
VRLFVSRFFEAEKNVAMLGFMTIVIGGLNFGIRKKSMACAAILTVLSGLGVLSSLLQIKLGGILFSFLMFGLIIAAAGSINTLKKYDLA